MPSSAQRPKSEIVEEVARQWLAQEDLYYYTRLMFHAERGQKWLKGKHHKIICDALTDVFYGKINRLIITCPPRYSKTELVVVNFITWALGRVPDSEFIYTSFSGDLTELNAWKCRDRIQHPLYRSIFPKVELRQDSKSRDHWRTTAGGCLYARAAGGTITGFGAGKLGQKDFHGALIIDDALKPEDARSDTIRNNVLSWYPTTFASRGNDHSVPIILIMQRLHENDLAGWLLAGNSGEKWTHICLPAIQDDGTALWPEKHTIEMLEAMREAQPYVFAGQYMQSPAPPEGNIFKPDQMKPLEAIPYNTIFARGWDLASSIDGDWTVGAKIGYMPDTGQYLIADMIRLRGTPDEVESTLLNTARREPDTMIRLPQDPGQAGKAQIVNLVKLLCGYRVTAMRVSGDKITRAQPLAAQVNVGNVCMLKAEWNDALLSELRNFPNSTYDDQVDALAEGFNEVMQSDLKIWEMLGQQMS